MRRESACGKPPTRRGSRAFNSVMQSGQGAGDATDFRGIRGSYAARERGCPFCDLADRTVIADSPMAVLILDGFPVTEGHMLVMPRRHVSDYFDLRQPERNAIQRLLEDGRARLRERYPRSPDSTSASTQARLQGRRSSTVTST